GTSHRRRRGDTAMRLAILDLLAIKTARHSAFRSRRQVLLATIAVLFLNSCRSATEPCTDCWTTKASMLTPDVEFGVGVMNGILYAVGAVVQAYDPVANSWTTKASMPTRRGGLGVGVVNGVLYAVGGEDGLYHCPFGGAPGPGPFLGVVEAYDPVANTWTTKASMPTPRARFGVGVTNGVLYAVGGSNCSGVAGDRVEAYDQVTDTWTSKASLPTAGGGVRVGVVDGVLYARRREHALDHHRRDERSVSALGGPRGGGSWLVYDGLRVRTRSPCVLKDAWRRP